MDEEHRLVDFHRLSSLVEKFSDKACRDLCIASHTRRFLARQMRKFRGNKSQSEFGNLIGRRQTVVSRLEDPNYGKWTLQTLFAVARKLNVAVVVRFVDFPTFLTFTEDMSENASDPKEFNQNDLDKMLAQRAIALPSQADARPEGARPPALASIEKYDSDFVGLPPISRGPADQAVSYQ